jgi:8-oxo-dGTP pyrophosphatase MutT (NUDIX family)
VLRKPEAGEWEVALCRRESEDLWALPKGTPSPAESIADTALREVREETGLEVEILAPLDTIRYSFVRQSSDALRYPEVRPGEPVLFAKEVHFFLMKPVGGSLSLHDKEFDEVRWVRISAAREKLTHENEARIVEKAVALSEGPSRGQARHQNRG